jgi:hypothetical protein
MKNKKFILLVFMLSAYVAKAKVWRVNNDATKDPDVSQIDALFDNNNANGEAAVDDTIHLEPSVIGYNGATITRRVVLIGNGYFLNNNAGLQANLNSSTIVGNIAFTATAAGGVASGITVNGSVLFSNTANITITRCLLISIAFTNYTTVNTGIVINKCYIRGNIEQSFPFFSGAGDVTVTFENNIICGETTNFGGGINLPAQVRGLFRNNIVGAGLSFVTLNNFYISNNIFVSNSGTNVITGGNNVIKNNLNNRGTAVTGGLPTGDGNLNITDVQMRGTSASTSTVFNGDVFSGTTTTLGDARWELKAGSPALNAGETIGAVVTPNMGAYGATDPYRKSGIPAVPTIYGLIVPPSVAPTATTMNVTISTRSNN